MRNLGVLFVSKLNFFRILSSQKSCLSPAIPVSCLPWWGGWGPTFQPHGYGVDPVAEGMFLLLSWLLKCFVTAVASFKIPLYVFIMSVVMGCMC